VCEQILASDEDALASYEQPAEGYRAWIVPAALVNPRMKFRIVAGG